MAVVNLGIEDLNVGELPATYTPFPYDQNLAYAIGAVFQSPDFPNIFSYCEVTFEVTVNNQPVLQLAPKTRLEIFPEVQLFYFPASPLFRGNGTCQIQVERYSFYRGGVDTVPVQLSIFYDDAITVPSWRA